MSPDPTWSEAATYLAAAAEHFEQLQTEVPADQPALAVREIDAILAALHKLREASVSENRRRSDELMARLDAEEAERLTRPAEPSAEILAEVLRLVRDGMRATPVSLLKQHTSMRLGEAIEYVNNLRATSREEVSRG